MTGMTENTLSVKSGNSRHLDRAKAFQIIYGLCFNPPLNQVDLIRRFQRAIYVEPLPGSIFFTEIAAGQDAENADANAPDNSKMKSSKNAAVPLPDIHAAAPENGENDKVITPDAKTSRAQPEGFAWELVQGVWGRQEDLDKFIRRFSQNWRLERMGKVELSLLRLAAYELLYSADVPPKVILNEAIELSRQFGDDSSHSFINGILDAVVKAVENGELKRAVF